MSVENSFYLVDWSVLKKNYEETKATDFIGEALENAEPWLEYFVIDEDNSYLYESWNAMIDFSDWYRNARREFQVEADKDIYNFFKKIGCVSDEEEKFTPIQELMPEEDEWVFSAISPESTNNLLEEFNLIDTHKIKKSIETAINDEVKELIPTFDDFLKYFNGFGKLIKTANDKKRGILVLAA